MKRDIFDLAGKAAIITGAGSGLGRSMAMGLAHYGANIVGAEFIRAKLPAINPKPARICSRQTWVR